MKKAFIDSDIILDLFAKREPFYESAALLFTLIEKKRLSGYTSPIVFANLHYILRKLKSPGSALEILRKLRTVISVLPVDERVIDRALNSGFSDFEDAIQYQCAMENNLDFIITRNKADYKKSRLSVLDAEEFVEMWNAEEP
ncbi:MAG: PIN domain-containing protein [Calditrichota bacterium]